MHRKLGSVCVAVGSLMLIAAVALFAYNRWDDWRAGNSVADIQDALETAEKAKSTDKLLNPTGTGGKTQDQEGDTEMATVEIDGYEYIGTLSIPRYGLELPIMSEWSYPGLKIAPGRYSGSVWSDDLILCGHNYERHFGNLKNLETGDEITFTDVDGNEFYYEVKEVIILQPTDVEEMVSQLSGEWDLTLFTCTIGGQTRVTVRCIRTEDE